MDRKRFQWTGIFAALTVVVTLGVLNVQADLDREASIIQKLGQAADPTAGKAPDTLAETANAARTIDDYLENHWKEHNVEPNPPAGDAIILRRLYLDIVGRIPSYEETVQFARSGSSTKRARLIDHLLESEGYVSHQYNFFADLLRIRSDAYGGSEYIEWIKSALRENKPYDEMVYELITAEGYPWENGAAGFYLRDDGMPLDHMSTTIENFLGTSLVCAQCHDHPFDKWTQYEFYEMAAFTSGIKTRVRPDTLREAAKIVKKQNPKAMQTFNNFTRPLTYGVRVTDAGIKLPHDYQYDDAKPNQPMKPFTIFGNAPKPGDDPHKTYAEWMTSPENPRFTMTIVNRLWKKVYGVPLIEPINAMTDDSKPTHAPLMDYLVYKMIDYDYDLKRFMRMLYNTRTYQRQSTDRELLSDETYRFTGPMMHRMSAEQVWDSIVTLVIPEPDLRPGPETGGYSGAQKLAYMTTEQLADHALKRYEYESKRNELDEKIEKAMEANNANLAKTLREQRNKLQAPKLPGGMMNSEPVTMASGMNMKQMGESGDKSGDYKTMMENKESSRPKVDPARWKGFPAGLVRASELRSPARNTHLLSIFGQSDRSVSDNSHTDSNILQVLAMFNGKIDQWTMTNNAVLKRNIDQASTPNDKLSVIFYSILNRAPTSYDRQMTEKVFGRNPDWSYVVWALLNTREFSFVQ